MTSLERELLARTGEDPGNEVAGTQGISLADPKSETRL